MKPFSIKRSPAQRGMTLIETLVALFVFTVVFLAALGLYQAANRAYIATDAATIQQQNARFALDRVVETLRDAGANYNTTGNSNVPDEQVEGAWESAIFVRGDYDNSREQSPLLESTTFPIVSTGNDEIVGYVLLKNGVGVTGRSIQIIADTSAPRNAVKSAGGITGEETVTVQTAARTLAEQTDPPYQLARVSLRADGTPQYQVIAENVFRLSFNYKNATGTAVITAGSNSGSDDAQRDVRASVRRIGVNLITMADRADFGYRDPAAYTTDAFGQTAPAAAAISLNRRKFDLSEEVTGVSLGRKGARHNVTPAVNIAAPASLTVCTGHYLNYFLSWPATATSGVATYRVHVQASAPVVNEYINVPATSYRYAQTDPTIQNYTFTVAGIAGNSAGTYTLGVTKSATHEALPASVPAVPTNVVAARAGTTNALAVNWDPVTLNTAPITTSTCTTIPGGNSVPPNPGWGIEAVDLANYRVYRKLYPGAADGDFAPVDTLLANRVDGAAIGDITNNTPRTPPFTDNLAAPCGQYFYRVRAYDGEGRVTAGNGSTAMTTRASYIPDAGITPATPQPPAPTGPVIISGGNFVFTLAWPPVVRDSAGNKAAVAHYEIRRESRVTGSAAWTPMSSLDVYEQTQVNDAVPTQNAAAQDMEYHYAVRAVYDCATLGSGNREATSSWYDLRCSPPPGNTITISIPTAGTAVSRPYETGFAPRLTVSGAGWSGGQVQILRPDGSVAYSEVVSGAPNASMQYNFPSWNAGDAASNPDGTYTVRAVGFAGICRSAPVTQTVTLETGTCGLELANPTLGPSSGPSGDRFKRLIFNLRNTCDGTGIRVDGFNLTWTGGPGGTQISAVNYNGSGNTSGLSATSGQAFSLTTPVAIAAGATSNDFEIVYTAQFTAGSTTWSSIIAHTLSPRVGDDETITSPITP